ncbi:hypothetical protein B0H19DRAFT_1381150 [Mycena capillaripes]|nr:hypothetical protein B0H19DRAFT_1381150 [Mycena capillaripes]
MICSAGEAGTTEGAWLGPRASRPPRARCASPSAIAFLYCALIFSFHSLIRSLSPHTQSPTPTDYGRDPINVQGTVEGRRSTVAWTAPMFGQASVSGLVGIGDILLCNAHCHGIRGQPEGWHWRGAAFCATPTQPPPPPPPPGHAYMHSPRMWACVGAWGKLEERAEVECRIARDWHGVNADFLLPKAKWHLMLHASFFFILLSSFLQDALLRPELTRTQVPLLLNLLPSTSSTHLDEFLRAWCLAGRTLHDDDFVVEEAHRLGAGCGLADSTRLLFPSVLSPSPYPSIPPPIPSTPLLFAIFLLFSGPPPAPCSLFQVTADEDEDAERCGWSSALPPLPPLSVPVLFPSQSPSSSRLRPRPLPARPPLSPLLLFHPPAHPVRIGSFNVDIL